MQNPILLLLRAIRLWLQGRVHFASYLDFDRREDRDETFHAFRKVMLDPGPEQPANPGASFQVRFRFKNLSAAANRRLSAIPTPLIVAQPGFRSKTWLLGAGTGDFMGYYEFDTQQDAETYWSSLPLAMMRRRAAEGTVEHKVAALD